ncbi:MAG: glycosyltransferase family 39 protein, partial [Ilumatobacteraceae bacterium]
LLVGGIAAAMFATHRPGHWWGDDWALYVRQANALLDGTTRQVFEQNRFTVEQSLGAPFSPPLYPWGFPLLMAPFIAVAGDDLDRLAIVQVLCACVFACCWYALARPRLGRTVALVGVVAVAFTPLFVGWSELVQTEWPYLATSGLALVGLDRVARRRGLVDVTAAFWPVVWVGIGAAAAFTVRREGLAMVPAVGIAQLAALYADRHRRWWTGQVDRVALVLRLLAPHLAALMVVVGLQWLLPSTLVPKYSGTSVANTWRFLGRHIDHLAEISGFKNTGSPDPTVFGNATLGWLAVATFLTLAVIGIGLSLTVFRDRDVHLFAYALVAFIIGGSFRSAINRYICTVSPLLMLFALVAVTTPLRRRGRLRHIGTAVALLAVGALATANIVNAEQRIDRSRAAIEAGSIEWGPDHPDAVAMFDEVMALTGPDDLVAAPKARAMTWATGRPSVQVDDYRPVPTAVTPAVVVTEVGSELTGQLEALPAAYTVVWRNQRFVIFQPSS